MLCDDQVTSSRSYLIIQLPFHCLTFGLNMHPALWRIQDKNHLSLQAIHI